MSTVVKDLGAVSAYAYAVEKGYTGTEAEFAELMADYAEVGQRAEDAADSALESKTAAQTAATTATNKATEATTAATTATNKAAEAQADADAAALDASQALSAASTATTKATEATTAAATATSAATTATTAKDDAVSAKTAAQTAQTGAETAAASVSASAAQITANAEDISQLRSDLSAIENETDSELHFAWVHGGIDNQSGENNNEGSLTRSRDNNYYFTDDLKSVTNNSSSTLWLIFYTRTDDVYSFFTSTKVDAGNTYTFGTEHKYVRFDIRGSLSEASAVSATYVDTSLIVTDILSLKDHFNIINNQVFTVEALSLELGGIDTAGGANVSSTTSLRTSEYIGTSAVKLTFQNSKVRFFAYTQDGTFVGGYDGTNGFTKDWSKYVRLTSPVYIDDIDNGNNYLYRLCFDNISGNVTSENVNAKLEISAIDKLKKGQSEEYTVGSNGDFTTFTEMLVALKDNANKKIVYVYGGTYDIFEEMGGAEYMASITDAASLNWRDVCHVVPWNTTIIGVGDVVLTWNPTDAEIIDQDHAFLFSPLNVSGTCKIKNIKIECSNARYGIHDETSGRTAFNGAVHEFENVSVIYSASTYGVVYAYGAGHNKNMKFKFKNCLFSAATSEPWSSHDWPASASEKSTFEFDNCIFLNTYDVASGQAGCLRFTSSDTVGRLDDVKINACVFDTIRIGADSASKQGYAITTTLCKAYTPTYSANIAEADRIAPKDYLILP